MVLINVEVRKITREAEGVRSFVLARRSRLNFPRYTPGSHIDVHCGEGIIRQYSLCGDPADRRHLMIAVRQVYPSRGGSDLMHKVVEEGDRLEIGAPRNNFPLVEDAPHSVLLAAGIGITPIIAMADRLHALGSSFEMHYFSRAPGHTAFRRRLTHGDFGDRVSFHEGLDPARTGEVLDGVLGYRVDAARVYICGPGPFMDRAREAAQGAWPEDSIHLERFAAKTALAGAPAHPFSVTLARRNLTLEVGRDQTILEVLEENGIDTAFSCEQGVCGTCVTDVLSGTPEHRDSFLSRGQRESGQVICLCVSRAVGDRIVLDL
ncbi:PDR/VanB family oxidoreductase [uncultured Roseobacter sp.]|uniref:PDR/VanB family oxidoreductase n=1 Tax=uncultured Roseobacter sp. TaxID=114847 RepID=UPI00262AA883|nr:PDR/VanB family oxidoreductase [uncultured Roseobacter sp.]